MWTDTFLRHALSDSNDMWAFRVCSIRITDEFTVLAGVMPCILQELQMSLKTGAREGFKEVLENHSGGEAAEGANYPHLCNLL